MTRLTTKLEVEWPPTCDHVEVHCLHILDYSKYNFNTMFNKQCMPGLLHYRPIKDLDSMLVLLNSNTQLYVHFKFRFKFSSTDSPTRPFMSRGQPAESVQDPAGRGS